MTIRQAGSRGMRSGSRRGCVSRRSWAWCLTVHNGTYQRQALGCVILFWNLAQDVIKVKFGEHTDHSFSLGQQPLRAPSVFNFYRPGYVPPNTGIANASLVAPEFQIIGETAVAGYTNFMQGVMVSGVGIGNPRDVRAAYTSELAVAANTDQLLDRMNRCLLYGSMPTQLRTEIRDAVNSISPTTPAGLANRVHTAALLTMASPEYLVQK
jgi:hypothetical protein